MMNQIYLVNLRLFISFPALLMQGAAVFDRHAGIVQLEWHLVKAPNIVVETLVKAIKEFGMILDELSELVQGDDTYLYLWFYTFPHHYWWYLACSSALFFFCRSCSHTSSQDGSRWLSSSLSSSLRPWKRYSDQSLPSELHSLQSCSHSETKYLCFAQTMNPSLSSFLLRSSPHLTTTSLNCSAVFELGVINFILNLFTWLISHLLTRFYWFLPAAYILVLTKDILILQKLRVV